MYIISLLIGLVDVILFSVLAIPYAFTHICVVSVCTIKDIPSSIKLFMCVLVLISALAVCTPLPDYIQMIPLWIYYALVVLNATLPFLLVCSYIVHMCTSSIFNLNKFGQKIHAVCLIVTSIVSLVFVLQVCREIKQFDLYSTPSPDLQLDNVSLFISPFVAMMLIPFQITCKLDKITLMLCYCLLLPPLWVCIRWLFVY